MNFPITCGTPSIPRVNTKGLVAKHVYTIISAHELDHHRLVKVRNPKGAKIWEGDWCPTSAEWYAPGYKRRMGLQAEAHDDSMFFMSFRDYVEQFQDTTICFYEQQQHP